MSHDPNHTGYPFDQLHRALRTAANHEDEATRDRAEQKAKKWQQVIRGIQYRDLEVGSRTPVKNVPGWLTLEVVTGGFATGGLSAGGELLSFENELLQSILPSQSELPSANVDRRLFNFYFISQPGFENLLQQLGTGNYEIEVPEEGALLVLAWLAKNGHVEKSFELLELLAPHFSKVRFYPRPTKVAQGSSQHVHLSNVRSVKRSIGKIKTPEAMLTQREAIEVWRPFREKVVSFLRSVGPADQPNLRATHTSNCSTLLAEYRSLRSNHRRCRKPLAKDSLAQTMTILEEFVEKGELNSSRTSRLGSLCQRYVQKFGIPESEIHQEKVADQLRQIRDPLFADIAKIAFRRLMSYPEHSGVETHDTLLADVKTTETNPSVPAQTPMPCSLVRKLQRCIMAPLEVLLEREIITSGDSLAVVLPQLTANLQALSVENPELRVLYAAIYRAFRRRRSLLLLNYQHQVQLEELPWINFIDRFRRENDDHKSAAWSACRQIAIMTLTHFPHSIVPNKLLQEFRAVFRSAQVKIPLVDELAADIFMGSFTNKFLEAAQIASQLLKDSLYETYYQIDFSQVNEIPLAIAPKTKKRSGFGPPSICQEFARLCQRRSVQGDRGNFVARNGTIIEQQQVLTTQNLASLIHGLDLCEDLRERYVEMAKNCFRWVCKQLQIQDRNFHARLVKVKNSAYAWRQMICFLALAPDGQLEQFIPWAKEYLQSQTEAFALRIDPAIKHLDNAIKATSSGKPLSQDHQPFYGWCIGKHWLLVDTKQLKRRN